MTTAPLPDDVRAMLARPNPAVITTVRPDGQPVSVATWYLLEPGPGAGPGGPGEGGDADSAGAPARILVNMDEGRRRLAYLRNDPRVSLTALDESSWYTHVSVQGRVTEMADDADLVDIDRLSRHYTGEPYGVRDRPRVSAWIEVDSWHGWGARARS